MSVSAPESRRRGGCEAFRGSRVWNLGVGYLSRRRAEPSGCFPNTGGEKIPVETGQDPVGLTRTDPTAHPSSPPNLLYAAALPKTCIFLIYFGN